MTVTPKNVLRHELIGLFAKIVESPDLTLQGMSGTIVFETKNMISIRKDSVIRQAAKKGCQKDQTSNPFWRLLYKWFYLDRKT